MLLYPEGTYWLLYKLLSAYIISFLHCHHEILHAFPYSSTFHLTAHKITNCFLFSAKIDKRILILWFRSSCCSIPTALKSLRQSKMKGNMGHSLQGPLLTHNHWHPRWSLSRFGHLFVFYFNLELLKLHKTSYLIAILFGYHKNKDIWRYLQCEIKTEPNCFLASFFG